MKWKQIKGVNYMRLEKLKETLAQEPGYRLKQANQAVFRNLIKNWKEATSLPPILQEELERKCSLDIDADFYISKDEDAVKALITLQDGLKIETVLMRHKSSRNTVCVSSQVGCPLGCLFCATGKLGFKRNLDAVEIVEQVLFFARYLKEKQAKVTNIVFMGMGEPFLNYDNVLEAIKILNNKDGFNLGIRHFSISTSGIVEGIKKLADKNLGVNLAISLHASDEKLREKIMPICKKYHIKDILEAVNYFIEKTRRKVMFEYIMIKDVNDSDECAKNLAKIMKNPLYFVNLISYNPTGNFKSSLPERVAVFKKILISKGVFSTERWRFGQDIEAACGQLAARQRQ